MQIIPLTTQSNQIFNITLNGFAWRIAVYEKKAYDDAGVATPRLYCDFELDSTLLVAGALASIGVPLLRHAYLTPGIIQEFYFIDTKGYLPPIAAGLGDRWFMVAVDGTDF